MDKRDLSKLFRERLKRLLDTEELSVAAFLRDTRIDRSALSQFLDPRVDRLPRAEALRQIAAARGVSVDWLLGLENAPEGRQEITPSVLIEQAQGPDGSTPLDAWRAEAAGLKLRYVPSLLPDMLLSPLDDEGPHGGAGETLLGGAELEDTDIEIAMPIQTLENLVDGSGLWHGLAPEKRRRQLSHMAALTAQHYPTLRLHLFDGRSTFAPPFSVFGKSRVAIYMGDSYLVMTGPDQIRSFTRLFDRLVRQSYVGPDRVDRLLADLARRVPKA
ncbi:MAG: transcriptional regulator [Pseudomonadota bacterium]